MEEPKYYSVLNLTQSPIAINFSNVTYTGLIQPKNVKLFRDDKNTATVKISTNITISLESLKKNQEIYLEMYAIRTLSTEGVKVLDVIVYEIFPEDILEVWNKSSKSITLWKYKLPNHKQINIAPSFGKVTLCNIFALHINTTAETLNKKVSVHLNWNKNYDTTTYSNNIKFTKKWLNTHHVVYIEDC